MLYLPWSHRLPDYVRARPEYGQDLVGLALALEQRRDDATSPMGVLDVGANVGDSAAQILDATSSARVLCVEADPYYLTYLRKNVGANPRAAIEEVLLTPNDDAWSSGATAVRKGGTTHFVASEDHEAMPMLSVGKLHEKYTDFDDLRLVKSDTDGWDTTLVPAIAREWADAGPVLHFEFDPGMTREVAGVDPNDVLGRARRPRLRPRGRVGQRGRPARAVRRGPGCRAGPDPRAPAGAPRVPLLGRRGVPRRRPGGPSGLRRARARALLARAHRPRQLSRLGQRAPGEQIWHGRSPTTPSGPSTRRSSGWCPMTAQSARWYTVPDAVA